MQITHTRTPLNSENDDRKQSLVEEREVLESLNDLIVERAEAIMYKGGIQALELLDADKKTIDTLKKNLKEEESF